jgi:hypothetical protein
MAEPQKKNQGSLSCKNKIILILMLMLFQYLFNEQICFSFERIICSFPNGSLIFKPNLLICFSIYMKLHSYITLV